MLKLYIFQGLNLFTDGINARTEVLRLDPLFEAWVGKKNAKPLFTAKTGKFLMITDRVLSRKELAEALHNIGIASHARTGRAARFLTDCFYHS